MKRLFVILTLAALLAAGASVAAADHGAHVEVFPPGTESSGVPRRRGVELLVAKDAEQTGSRVGIEGRATQFSPSGDPRDLVYTDVTVGVFVRIAPGKIVRGYVAAREASWPGYCRRGVYAGIYDESRTFAVPVVHRSEQQETDCVAPLPGLP